MGALENLTPEEKVVYELLRSELSAIMDQKLKDQQDSMLKAVTSLVANATTKIDSAATRLEAMRTEFGADIGELRLYLYRLTTTADVALKGRGTSSSEEPAAPAKPEESPAPTKSPELYIPPHAKGTRASFPSTSRTPPDSPTHVDASNSAPRVELPRFDDSNPQLWQSRCEDYFLLWGTPGELWISYATAQFEGAAARWLESVKRRAPRATWEEFCALLQNRFGRNQHQAFDSASISYLANINCR